jgi:two-component system cell cycle sensor histidine kinase/response regulator CckA
VSVVRQLGPEAFASLDPDLLSTFFDHFPDCLLLVENERILLANRACLQLLGHSSCAALAGQHASAVLSPNRFCRTLSPAISRCQHPACEQLLHCVDGEQVRADVQCTSFRHGNREFVLAVIRPRQRLELARAIRDPELRFRAMFEAAAIGISICSLDGRVLESNPAVTRMLGYTSEELAGMHPRELHPDDFEQDEVLIAELVGGIHDSFELDKRFRRKDGTFFWGRVHVSTVRSADRQPAFLIAMLEDTTARRRVEEQLREAEKMEVIGRLAGGVAHDFNNLLTGILLYCDLLSAALPSGDRLRQYVEEVRMAGEQGAALTQQLLTVARKQVAQPRPVLLNDIVSSTQNLMRRLIGEPIELVTDLCPNLGSVLADQAQIRQVLLNLVLNARDAMPQGGRITVTTRSAAFPGNGQPAVVLSVADTGCGMDAATRAHIFEPFFTTKETGRGTGLGLATVRRIVDECSGAIDVESELGRGSRIDIAFPLPAQTPDTALPGSRPAPTVLLVDDNGSACHSMQHTLLQAGFRVLQAHGAKPALKIFADQSPQVDLLVADRMMSGMDGHELAEELRRQKPGLKVLLISGYGNDRSPSVLSSVRLIHKPFSGTELIERIREVLDSPGDLPC